MKFKENLKTLRKQKGFSQSELGAACGLKPCAISHYETGVRMPCARNLRNICLALNCSADDLILK